MERHQVAGAVVQGKNCKWEATEYKTNQVERGCCDSPYSLTMSCPPTTTSSYPPRGRRHRRHRRGHHAHAGRGHLPAARWRPAPVRGEPPASRPIDSFPSKSRENRTGPIDTGRRQVLFYRPIFTKEQVNAQRLIDSGIKRKGAGIACFTIPTPINPSHH